MKCIINVRYYDFSTYQEDMYVVFKEVIHEIGKMSDFKDDNYEIIDGSNQLLMPSLVVGHSHIYSTFARGLIVDFHPNNFVETLEQMWWRLDRQIDKKIIHDSAFVKGIDYLKNGVTSVIDHHASGDEIIGTLSSIKEALVDELGMRGMFCFETSDRFNIEESIDENISFMEQNNDKNARGLFGLHASLSLSEETLIEIKKHNVGYPIHIHCAESIMDQEDSIEKYNKRVIERLDDHGLLYKNSIITHALHVSDRELDILKKQECVVAMNVSSNMNNGVGLPEFMRFYNKGIPVILGNDGLSSSITTEWLSLYYAMHYRYQGHITFNLDHLLGVINNTYHYFNKMMNIKIGRVEVGYEGDLLLHDYIPPTTMNQENAFGHVFFGMANSFKPRHVFKAGNHLVKDYEVSDELNETYKSCKQSADKLWNKINNDGVK